MEQLRSEGYDAVNVDLNNNYRPEKDAANVTEMTEFHPEFSHRYAALASGVGRLGWSGNLLTKEYGAQVELGSVLTSAVLTPDTPIPDEDHPCDRCKVCCQVCPVEMVHPKASVQVTVAGVTETISRKRPNTCCWIGCTGYEGLASPGTWSNWSPYRLGSPLPENKQELDSLCISLQKADPQMQTPFGLNVVIPREELSEGRPTIQKWPGQFPLDREVIKYLSQYAKSAGANSNTTDMKWPASPVRHKSINKPSCTGGRPFSLT